MNKTLTIVLLLSVLLTSCASPSVTGDDVVQAFKAAGLEAENTQPMTKDDYGAAPYLCTGTRFYIPSLGENKGGRILVCDNAADRDAMANFYTELGQSSALFFSWVFVKGNVVVQINGDLPEEQAIKYEAAIP
jgi:hypothetical protein